MTTERDIERILDTWLADGPNAVADRVLDVVTDRIEHQPQRSTWHLRLRETTVTTRLKPIAAIAAVLVVAVVSLVAVVGLTSRGGVAAPGPSATPGVTATPGPTASPTGTPNACEGESTCAGPLPAGEHTAANFLLGLTFTTPEGWVNVRDIRRTYGLDEPTGLGAKIEVLGMNAIAEQTESCGPVPKAGVGSSVQDFITAVQTHPGLVAADPVPAEIDGFQGQSIDFVIASTWDQMCPDMDPFSPIVLMLTDTGEPPGRTLGYNVDTRARWIVLDVRGETIIVELVGPVAENSFSSSVARSQPIIDSLQFGAAR
jgi:hypothetical protein